MWTNIYNHHLYENPDSKITHLHMHDSLNSEYGQNLLVFSVTRRSRSDAVHLLSELLTYWVMVSIDLTDVTLVSDDDT